MFPPSGRTEPEGYPHKASTLALNSTPAQKLSSRLYCGERPSVRGTLESSSHVQCIHEDRTVSFRVTLSYDHGTEDTLHALWPGLHAKYSAPNVEVRGRRGARKKGLCVSYGSSSRFVWEGRIQGSGHTELGWKQRNSPQNGLIF